MRTLAVAVGLTLALSSAHADRRRYYAQPFTPAWAAPQLQIRPAGGPPGTQIEISGVTFHDDVRVFYGDRPMAIVEGGRRHVVAVIPPGARGDDFIYVVDVTGRARSVVPFDVVRPRHRPYYRH
jgi:hypothetical protein